MIDQFLRSNSNKRTDEYEGTKENRIKFLIEITRAVIDTVGKEKTGFRLSPFISFKDMDDPEILETIMLAATELNPNPDLIFRFEKQHKTLIRCKVHFLPRCVPDVYPRFV